MTIADPYPETLAEIDDQPGLPAMDPTVKALNRIAVALEQLVLNQLDRPQPVQNAPGAALTALPPVRTADVCPIHGTPWKVVPAGISKKSGKPYESFRACSTAGCDQRPR
jgi:hypothetical protein